MRGKTLHARRVLAAVGATAVALSGAALVGVPVAEAAGGTAPARIVRVIDNQAHARYVWVRNECGRTMRIKIIVRGAPDTGRTTLRHGQSREWKLTWGSYERTVVC
ncbi:hypothetical protein LX15_001365 [Streptoalloteichus tenebrarius]|uniref:Secreted protein n=1 Tax=Streptoalloteichus tenebrarius (strain ATCC 17920 / DSM 40477 / JCM 4838 / CBS 697.72 / NBRC 16177 / NCIMB 11028 / NRRL B-12390 / A12253. 1 / ISP 5477) TaxID=1933 RepID=A0ABT1HQ91_STRSD|nr:hypothetical protein [Streptoalloteichus tenebrarius]MCP2257680.1 hypothetical protein [Streptoalloteichus tenebrarius]BFE98640.1 hypothetical protein GCM10020241_03160 [Streptoalloteichus tenebrarius]